MRYIKVIFPGAVSQTKEKVTVSANIEIPYSGNPQILFLQNIRFACFYQTEITTANFNFPLPSSITSVLSSYDDLPYTCHLDLNNIRLTSAIYDGTIPRNISVGSTVTIHPLTVAQRGPHVYTTILTPTSQSFLRANDGGLQGNVGWDNHRNEMLSVLDTGVTHIKIDLTMDDYKGRPIWIQPPVEVNFVLQ